MQKIQRFPFSFIPISIFSYKCCIRHPIKPETNFYDSDISVVCFCQHTCEKKTWDKRIFTCFFPSFTFSSSHPSTLSQRVCVCVNELVCVWGVCMEVRVCRASGGDLGGIYGLIPSTAAKMGWASIAVDAASLSLAFVSVRLPLNRPWVGRSCPQPPACSAASVGTAGTDRARAKRIQTGSAAVITTLLTIPSLSLWPKTATELGHSSPIDGFSKLVNVF